MTRIFFLLLDTFNEIIGTRNATIDRVITAATIFASTIELRNMPEVTIVLPITIPDSMTVTLTIIQDRLTKAIAEMNRVGNESATENTCENGIVSHVNTIRANTDTIVGGLVGRVRQTLSGRRAQELTILRNLASMINDLMTMIEKKDNDILTLGAGGDGDEM